MNHNAAHDMKCFKLSLKRFLYHHSFYSVEEYYKYMDDRDMSILLLDCHFNLIYLIIFCNLNIVSIMLIYVSYYYSYYVLLSTSY
jgi:hypothetical protein